MRQKYNPQKIERKWQKVWDKSGIYRAKDGSRKKKSYILVEFPYPSGEGLHVGHCRPYIAFDVLSRKRRMENFNVMYPMGWDAFGLPTENYAVKTGIHPRIATRKNTAFFKRQQKSIGLSFDWSREINTTEPAYYKWTQWIFLQLFKNGLAYKAKMPVNWCPSCKIVLANEEVVDGSCERCGAKVTKEEKEQWLLRITKYAERLINDLDLVDYPEKVKTLQRDWIGRSEGALIEFPISNFPAFAKASAGRQFSIEVFTTRPDTLFGATYVVLAPEHPFIENYKSQITNYKHVEKYIEEAKEKTDIQRAAAEKEKTGIELKGIKVINPATKEEIPVWIADYVLMGYGTGAIMAVPWHDERDRQFAEKYGLPLVDRPLIPIAEAIRKFGKKRVQYKLRDWIFSRQRYWGEPIPLIFCEKEGWVAVPEKDLPVKLPNVKDYKPTEAGDSPLAKVKNWVEVKCPKCGGPARRETDVMPNWAGSNWYFMRYCDPKNGKKLADPKKLMYWMPVDWYNGGMEHSTLHLLYSRFIYKFLWDIGAVPKSLGPEPYKKRTSHGVILGEGSIKMSKSKGNVITPDEVISRQGADTLRIYEMFMGPFGETIAWDAKGVNGARRFLQKVWELFDKVQNTKHKTQDTKHKLDRLLHKTIKKVTEDIENLRFNTAISALMILVNEMLKVSRLSVTSYQTLIKLLAPFAPHITEELWQKLNQKKLKSEILNLKSIHEQSWPKHDPRLIKEETFTLLIQVNGKVRDKIEVETDISEAEAKKLAISSQNVRKWIDGKEVKKVVFVPGKLINIVTQ